jgi:hypothetical protein
MQIDSHILTTFYLRPYPLGDKRNLDTRKWKKKNYTSICKSRINFEKVGNNVSVNCCNGSSKKNRALAVTCQECVDIFKSCELNGVFIL